MTEERIKRIIYRRRVRTLFENVVLTLLVIGMCMLLTMLCSCRSCRCVEGVDSQVRDCTWVVEVPCTVYYDVPMYSAGVVVSLDSLSHLENPLAVSEAWVDALGLHHTLATKPQRVEVATKVKERYRMIVRDRTIRQVVRERKSWKDLMCYPALVFVGFVIGWIARRLKCK